MNVKNKMLEWMVHVIRMNEMREVILRVQQKWEGPVRDWWKMLGMSYESCK
jgi:hypothetical protein